VVDTQRFKPAGGSTRRPLTLLAVGRLAKQKRFDRFISLLGRVRAELNRELRGWIVGPAQEPGLRKELEVQAAHLGLFPGCLEFLGGVSNMGPLYQHADISVLTSDFEGTPNVLLEAMASGLPVVATKVGGVPDIVLHGESGFVVECEDFEGLAAALAELVSNDSRRLEMGRRAREFVELNHSLERLPGYLEKLYERVLPLQHPGRLRVIEETPGPA
jgi:glycosyltransferase involved in cell wall biosynthesis